MFEKNQKEELVPNEDGNGHHTVEEIEKIFEGGKGTLGEVQEEMGTLAKMASSQNKRESVMMSFISPSTDENYREILLVGISDVRMARLASAAIEESQRFGVPITSIVDRIHAEASTVIGSHKEALLNAMNSFTYTKRQNGAVGRFGRWFNRNREDATNSNLS